MTLKRTLYLYRNGYYYVKVFLTPLFCQVVYDCADFFVYIGEMLLYLSKTKVS